MVDEVAFAPQQNGIIEIAGPKRGAFQVPDVPMPEIDWLSRLLETITVAGRLEVRCAYGAPWRVSWPQAAAHEIPYHVVIKGRAIIEDPETKTVKELRGGDIVLLPRGTAHELHDGSGQTPGLTYDRQGPAGWLLSENNGQGEHLNPVVRAV